VFCQRALGVGVSSGVGGMGVDGGYGEMFVLLGEGQFVGSRVGVVGWGMGDIAHE